MYKFPALIDSLPQLINFNKSFRVRLYHVNQWGTKTYNPNGTEILLFSRKLKYLLTLEKNYIKFVTKINKTKKVIALSPHSENVTFQNEKLTDNRGEIIFDICRNVELKFFLSKLQIT